ncbi:type IV pilus assembly protein PilM [Candidatus Parcubacteria bacterium]|nr:type IV pilus assembly protein PilM [Candidatus Parcubacteria bacterium]
MEFLSLKTNGFGMDISDLSVKIVKLKKRRGVLSLACFGETEIKPGIIKDGEIQDKEALVEIIKKALNKVKGEKLNSRYVVASLPEEKAFLQVIQMPKMSKDELKKAVLFEAENYIPLSLTEVYLDFQIVQLLHNHLDRLEVLIAASPKKIVDPYVYVLKKAGLQPKILEVESSAISRALIKDELTVIPLFLIDIGATRTSFIIFSGHSLRLTSSVLISSQKFTDIISRAMKIDSEQAEKVKWKYGLKDRKTKKGKQVFEALVPILTDLGEQIKLYLDYYRTHAAPEHIAPNGKKVEKILLCGGGANLPGLCDELFSQLKIPVETGNPWINILSESSKEIPKVFLGESLKYTTALGLALRAVKEI